MNDAPVLRMSVSSVIFALRRDAASERPVLVVPLVRRTREPFLGLWALPGGWLPPDEELADAASRTLKEATGLAPRHLEQLHTFGGLDRSAAARVVSIVYWGLVAPPETEHAMVGENTAWFPADDVPALAFDHAAALSHALGRLRASMGYAQIARGFFGPAFTRAQLREVQEAVRRRRLDPDPIKPHPRMRT